MNISEMTTKALDLIEENDGVFVWEEAIRLLSHLLQTSPSTAEYVLGRMLASQQLVVRRGRLEVK